MNNWDSYTHFDQMHHSYIYVQIFGFSLGLHVEYFESLSLTPYVGNVSFALFLTLQNLRLKSAHQMQSCLKSWNIIFTMVFPKIFSSKKQNCSEPLKG